LVGISYRPFVNGRLPPLSVFLSVRRCGSQDETFTADGFRRINDVNDPAIAFAVFREATCECRTQRGEMFLPLFLFLVRWRLRRLRRQGSIRSILDSILACFEIEDRVVIWLDNRMLALSDSPQVADPT
jgi:hypothetical protein